MFHVLYVVKRWKKDNNHRIFNSQSPHFPAFLFSHHMNVFLISTAFLMLALLMLLLVEKGFKMFYVILVHIRRRTYNIHSFIHPLVFEFDSPNPSTLNILTTRMRIVFPPLVSVFFCCYFILTKETFSHETKYLLCVKFILISFRKNIIEISMLFFSVLCSICDVCSYIS